MSNLVRHNIKIKTKNFESLIIKHKYTSNSFSHIRDAREYRKNSWRLVIGLRCKDPNYRYGIIEHYIGE